MNTVTLVTKEGCHLCENVEEVLSASPSRKNFELEFRRLDEDRFLLQMYVLRIPVVLVDGTEVLEAKDMDLQGRWKARLEGILAGLKPT